jgi:DNA polymerase-1
LATAHVQALEDSAGTCNSCLEKKKRKKFAPVVYKYNNLIRQFFVAEENRVLIGADYASLEVVIFADDAGDEPLLDMIRHSRDFYSEMAIGALGLQEYSSDKSASNFLKKHKPEVRQAAKVYGLGIRYGMESYKLSKTLRISESEAKLLSITISKKFPKLKTRMSELKQQAIMEGTVRS